MPAQAWAPNWPQRRAAGNGMVHVMSKHSVRTPSVSIPHSLTLPPLSPQWDDIHPKSMPLMLDLTDEDLIAKWLDPDFSDVEQFARCLEPHLPGAMRVTRIGKPSRWNPIEDAFMIVS